MKKFIFTKNNVCVIYCEADSKGEASDIIRWTIVQQNLPIQPYEIWDSLTELEDYSPYLILL